jgi:hypothetical protein
VSRGEPVLTVRYNNLARWQAARPLVAAAFSIGGGPARRRRLVLETVT